MGLLELLPTLAASLPSCPISLPKDSSTTWGWAFLWTWQRLCGCEDLASDLLSVLQQAFKLLVEQVTVAISCVEMKQLNVVGLFYVCMYVCIYLFIYLFIFPRCVKWKANESAPSSNAGTREETSPEMLLCLMCRTSIWISPRYLVVSPGAKPQGKFWGSSSLTGQRNTRAVACVMFSTRQDWEKLSHGSSLVLRPCSQILGWGKFMAVKE